MKRLFASLIPAAWIYLMASSPLYADTTAYIPNAGDDNVKKVVSDAVGDTPADVADCGPYGAAVTPDGDDLVITCNDDNSVVIISTASFEKTATYTLETPMDIRGVAIESSGTYAYVADYGANKVYKIEISNGDVTIYDEGDGIGVGPWGVAATYDRVAATIKVYVSNNGSNSVSVISDSGVDTIDFDTINSDSGPLGLALTPDGKYLYVALHNVNRVAVMDTSDNSIDATTISTENDPWGVAMADDGAFVFVTNSGSNSVTVIDTSTKAAVDRNLGIGVQPWGVAAPVNGKFAYVVDHAASAGGYGIYRITTSGTFYSVGEEGALNGAIALGAFIGDTQPTAPSSLVATADGSDITLTWNDNSAYELGFKIERREDGEDAYTQIDKVGEDETEYTDYNLIGETTYYYRVRAYKEASDSDYSASANATTTEAEDFSWCFINTVVKK